MDSLPVDLLGCILCELPTVGDVATAYIAIPQIRNALRSEVSQTPRLLMLPVHGNSQLNILNILNAKFKLQAAEPICWPRLIHAYRRLSTCSISARLIRAAELGDADALNDLHGEWYQSVSYMAPILRERLGFLDVCEYEQIYNVEDVPSDKIQCDLAIISYDNDHIGLEYDASSDLVFQAGVRCHLRKIRRPHKLLSTRSIIKDNFGRLYSTEVADTDKHCIWQTQYSPILINDPDILGNDRGQAWAHVSICAGGIDLLKDLHRQIVDCGLIRSPGLIECILASGNMRAIDMLTREITPKHHEGVAAGLLKMLKRGYWEAFVHAVSVVIPNSEYIWFAPGDILRSLSKFTLKEIISWTDAIVAYLTHKGMPIYGLNVFKSAEQLLRKALELGYWPLVQEILQEHPTDALTLINYTMNHTEPITPQHIIYLSELLTQIKFNDVVWQELSYLFSTRHLFWSSMWKYYGKEQVEASLMYLKRVFGVTVNPQYHETEKGLVEYMLGYRIVNNELVPIPGSLLDIYGEFAPYPAYHPRYPIISQEYAQKPKLDYMSMINFHIETDPDIAELWLRVMSHNEKQ